MLRKLEIRAGARRDLRRITLYIAEKNGDLIVAERFAQRLLDRCANLLIAPGMGTRYLQRPGVHKINEGAYKVFYKITEDKVVILKIWDGRRGHDPVV